MARRTKALILDSWTVLAYLQDEPAAEKIGELIATAHEEQTPLMMSIVNVCEVWYILAREISGAEADSSVSELHNIGIQFVDADWTLAKAAAEFKAKHKMSLADCFAAALAKENKADLVTGDQEFKQVESAIRISWL